MLMRHEDRVRRAITSGFFRHAAKKDPQEVCCFRLAFRQVLIRDAGLQNAGRRHSCLHPSFVFAVQQTTRMADLPRTGAYHERVLPRGYSY